MIVQSFLSCIIGRDRYDTFKNYARLIIAIGTCILIPILLLSMYFHFNFIRGALNLVTGTSIFFVIYVAAFVVLLDIEVIIDDIEEDDYYYSKPNKPKPAIYKLTIIWGIILIAIGIYAIYISDQYRKHYAFECDTFLVDNKSGIYHLDFDNDCKVASKTDVLEKMQGYQINESYTLCEWCKEWAEDVEAEYNYNRYCRR